MSFNPHNEGEDLRAQALAYRRRHGCYLEVICADQIYRIRSNRAFCQRHAIRLSGPRLGRPKNDPELKAAHSVGDDVGSAAAVGADHGTTGRHGFQEH